jgi:hypothetical protein
MADPQLSKTTINPGSGGDDILDFIITAPDGTTRKAQGVVLCDPVDPLAQKRVDVRGMDRLPRDTVEQYPFIYPAVIPPDRVGMRESTAGWSTPGNSAPRVGMR